MQSTLLIVIVLGIGLILIGLALTLLTRPKPAPPVPLWPPTYFLADPDDPPTGQIPARRTDAAAIRTNLNPHPAIEQDKTSQIAREAVEQDDFPTNLRKAVEPKDDTSDHIDPDRTSRLTPS